MSRSPLGGSPPRRANRTAATAAITARRLPPAYRASIIAAAGAGERFRTPADTLQDEITIVSRDYPGILGTHRAHAIIARLTSSSVVRVECMTDFRPNILRNLRIYSGIVEVPERIDVLNETLNDLDASGFGELVQNFCTQPDSERARDFLFEIWICQMLRRNHDVQYLQYEPPNLKNPPDFRFLLHGVSFEIQVKRLHNVTNEQTRFLFERECRKHLSKIPKPWLINFWVSDQFTPQHLNSFFAIVKRSIDQFSSVTTLNTILGEPRYSWKEKETTLVRFSFTEKPSNEPGIFPGIISLMGTDNGLLEPIDIAVFRRAVERLLKKSRKSLTRPVSPTHSNLLVMQSVHFPFARKSMPNTLYGDEVIAWDRSGGVRAFCKPNGLFRPNKFSNICGLVLVSSQTWGFSERFEGDYFLHPSHVQNIQCHPKPFDEMMFFGLRKN